MKKSLRYQVARYQQNEDKKDNISPIEQSLQKALDPDKEAGDAGAPKKSFKKQEYERLKSFEEITSFDPKKASQMITKNEQELKNEITNLIKHQSSNFRQYLLSFGGQDKSAIVSLFAKLAPREKLIFTNIAKKLQDTYYAREKLSLYNSFTINPFLKKRYMEMLKISGDYRDTVNTGIIINTIFLRRAYYRNCVKFNQVEAVASLNPFVKQLRETLAARYIESTEYLKGSRFGQRVLSCEDLMGLDHYIAYIVKSGLYEREYMEQSIKEKVESTSRDSRAKGGGFVGPKEHPTGKLLANYFLSHVERDQFVSGGVIQTTDISEIDIDLDMIVKNSESTTHRARQTSGSNSNSTAVPSQDDETFGFLYNKIEVVLDRLTKKEGLAVKIYSKNIPIKQQRPSIDILKQCKGYIIIEIPERNCLIMINNNYAQGTYVINSRQVTREGNKKIDLRLLRALFEQGKPERKKHIVRVNAKSNQAVSGHDGLSQTAMEYTIRILDRVTYINLENDFKFSGSYLRHSYFCGTDAD